MKNSDYVWLTMLIIWLVGCQKQPDVLPGSVTYDIVGSTYPNGTFVFHPGNPVLYATSIRPGFCPYEVISSQMARPITEEAQLLLSLNIPARVSRYRLRFDRDSKWDFCAQDSINTVVVVEERPVPGYIDLQTLVTYRIIDGDDSFLEVTRFDAEKRWIEGKFQLKAVRFRAMGYPLPLADTLVIANGKFGFGFKRE